MKNEKNEEEILKIEEEQIFQPIAQWSVKVLPESLKILRPNIFW